MSTTVEHEWVAVNVEDESNNSSSARSSDGEHPNEEDEEIIEQAYTKKAIEMALIDSGKSPNDYEIVAVPKAHSTIIL